MTSERILLNPKLAFLANAKAASAHSDQMASPAFQAAATQALLAYQFRLGGSDPQVLAISMSKIRGAQEFLRELMNLGLPDAPGSDAPDTGRLTPPEESLDRPYAPPPRK